jgi:gas vesicle protein
MPTEGRGGDWGFVLTFLAGALTGATVALLAAPRSGRETRARLRQRARAAGEQARDLREDLHSACLRAAQAAQESFLAALEPEARDWTRPHPGESEQ